MDYERSGHARHLLIYHLIWCPKYRRPVLQGPVAERLRELVREIAAVHAWQVVEVSVQPDHVHLFLRCLPTDTPHRVMRAMKGTTSRVLRQEFASLRSRLPTLWTHAYLVGTRCPTPDEIVAYVAQQPRS